VKFAQIKQGAAAVERVECTTVDGTPFVAAARVLMGEDDDAILSAAQQFTIERKGTPKEGDPIYDFAINLLTVLHGYDDPDTPGERFFASAEEVRKRLDRERIAYLAERQQAHQDTVSPSARKLDPAQFVESVWEHAKAEEGASLPFERWPPALRRSFVRSMAVALATSPPSRSPHS